MRSSASGDIGFLSVQNRMVVALSRARQCLFMVGNAHLLAARSNLWCSVLTELDAARCLGPALPAVAGRPGRVIPVALPSEFGLCASAGYARQAARAGGGGAGGEGGAGADA